MRKIGICGFFSFKEEDYTGQLVKTREIYYQLQKNFGEENVSFVDTYHWKKNPLKLLLECFKLARECQAILFLPAHKGVKVFIPLFQMLNNLFHRDLHYVVVGGWLPELLASNTKLKNKVRKLKGVYVETQVMVNALERLGLNNVVCIPNFKHLDVLKEDELVYPEGEPYKLCTFSRVMKEKGIEDAIKAVIEVNNAVGRVSYCLDIFGKIDDGYQDRFEILRKGFPDYIVYRGVVQFDKSVEVVKEYFALLFPTQYKGEGFAGTILDAYAAGVPVIATDWRYNAEIIHDKLDGLIYDFQQPGILRNILLKVQDNPSEIINMKRNCIKRARDYSPENIFGKLLEYL